MTENYPLIAAQNRIAELEQKNALLRRIGRDLWREFYDQRAQFDSYLWQKHEDKSVVFAARELFGEATDKL